MAYFQEQKSEHFCPLCHAVGVAKKNKLQSKHWMEQHFTHMETEQGGLQQWVLATRGLLAAYSGQLSHMHPS